MKRSLCTGLVLWLMVQAIAGIANAEPAVVVAGMDLTATYNNQPEAKMIIAKVINSLRPGDVIHLHTIVKRSYGPESSVFRAEIPRPIDKPKNQYDRRGWFLYKQSLRKARLAKIWAIKSLAALKQTQALKRDLYGFLNAAEEKFNNEAPKAKRFLLIASTMQPSWHYQTLPDLAGVEIHVVGFSAGQDPDYVRRLVRSWKKVLLNSCHAKSVSFFPLGVNYQLKLD